MKAVTLISKLLENCQDLSSCGIHTFEENVRSEAICCFGDFNAAILPKPGMTYFYQWIDITRTPAIPELDALLLQGDESVPMAIYFWQID